MIGHLGTDECAQELENLAQNESEINLTNFIPREDNNSEWNAKAKRNDQNNQMSIFQQGIKTLNCKPAQTHWSNWRKVHSLFQESKTPLSNLVLKMQRQNQGPKIKAQLPNKLPTAKNKLWHFINKSGIFTIEIMIGKFIYFIGYPTVYTLGHLGFILGYPKFFTLA